MTIKEMSEAIENYCDASCARADCTCKLYELVKDGGRNCYSYDKGDAKSEAVIVENYKVAFGEPDRDSVNHPSHYCQEASVECIDEMVAVFGREAVMNFCLLNVWKYRKRAIFKNGEEDLKKSDWYMNKFVELKGRW